MFGFTLCKPSGEVKRNCLEVYVICFGSDLDMYVFFRARERSTRQAHLQGMPRSVPSTSWSSVAKLYAGETYRVAQALPWRGSLNGHTEDHAGLISQDCGGERRKGPLGRLFVRSS